MTSHKDYQLDQLGITSQHEADQLERNLDVRFDRFAYYDREVWVQQNAYLDAFAHTGTVSDAADAAGITLDTAHQWKFLDTLGFKHRMEEAVLRFSDSVQVMALERAREPNAPAALLIALLRAHVPEKYSPNGHICDTSKTDESFLRYGQGAQRERDSGYQYLRNIADGDHNPPDDSPTHTPHSPHEGAPSPVLGSTPSPVLGEGWGEGRGEGQQPDHSQHVGAGLRPAHDPSAVNPHAPYNRHTGEMPAPDPIRGRHPEAAHHPSSGLPYEDHNTRSNDFDAPDPSPHDDIQPIDPDEIDFFNLSPSESSPSPVLGSSPSPVVGEGWGEGQGEGNPPAPDTQNPEPPPTPSPVVGEGRGEGRGEGNSPNQQYPRRGDPCGRPPSQPAPLQSNVTPYSDTGVRAKP